MKKFLALVMATMMICAVMTTAMAETTIEWEGEDTRNFHSWTTPADSSGGSWHIVWGENTNIASNLRAVVRVHSGERAASATWVYSSKSEKYHPYNSGFGYGACKTELRGRLDNRDSGWLIVDGTFYN